MNKMLFIILLNVALATLLACKTVQLKDTQACTTAGKISVGADCDTAYSHQRTSKNMDEWIDFLEPSATHAGAVCMAAEDWTAELTELEQACSLTNNSCIAPVVNAIDHLKYRLNYLKHTSRKKYYEQNPM